MQIQCTWTCPELRLRPSTLVTFSKHFKRRIGSVWNTKGPKGPNSFVATMSSTTADNQVASSQNGSTQNSNPPLQVFFSCFNYCFSSISRRILMGFSLNWNGFCFFLVPFCDFFTWNWKWVFVFSPFGFFFFFFTSVLFSILFEFFYPCMQKGFPFSNCVVSFLKH